MKLNVDLPFELEICNECGRSVAQGSGNFVNRVPDCDDVETRIEMGKPFPKGEYLCEACDEGIYENEYEITIKFKMFANTKEQVKLLAFEYIPQHSWENKEFNIVEVQNE